MKAVAALDQLGGDPQALAGLADAAFQHVIDPELGADQAQVVGLALEGEARRAPRHAQGLDLGELVQQLL